MPGGRRAEILYEYRMWPEDVTPVRDFAAQGTSRQKVMSRTDWYILGETPYLLAKIRGGRRFEIKAMIGEAGPAQLWVRTFTSRFPLAPEVRPLMREVCPDAEFTRAMLRSPDAFVSALAGHAVICAVAKTRRLFKGQDMKAELTRVRALGRTALTVAVEATALEPVNRFLEAFGQHRLPNRDYGAWLREVLISTTVGRSDALFFAADGLIEKRGPGTQRHPPRRSPGA
jgi:hypothetical protein